MITDIDLYPIKSEEYLTETEDDEDGEEYINFYKFLSTQIQKNKPLMMYFWEILGVFEPRDLEFLEAYPDIIGEIYKLLDTNGKGVMRYQYLREIRILTKIATFDFMEIDVEEKMLELRYR